MKVLRGTLTFVLGIIIGIILFVVAIGGTIVALATTITVGELQNKTNVNIVDQNSEIYGKTVWDTAKLLLDDIKNFDKISIKTLYDKYGISFLNEFSGIDFTNKDFYSVPITSLFNDVSVLTNSFSLNEIGKLAAIDFTTYGIPLLTKNADNSVKVAIDNVLSSLNGDMTIRSIKDNFGIDLGADDNALITKIQDLTISDFGGALTALPLNEIITADTDTFLKKTGNPVYIKADRYEEVSAADIANADYVPPVGVRTFISGAADSDGDGTTDTLVKKELRYVKDGENFVVDNSCYKQNTETGAEADAKTFYRYVEYQPYTGEPDDAQLFVPSFANHVEAVLGDGSAILSNKGFFPLADIAGNVTLNQNRTMADLKDEAGTAFGFTDETVSTDSTLKEGGVGFVRVHTGSAVAVLKRVSFMTVGELQNADNFLNDITVGEIVDIGEDAAKIMKALKNTKLGNIASDINKLTIDDLIDINESSPLILRSLAQKNCSLENFSSAIDSLALGEVIEIDADVYSPASYEYIENHPTESFFYLDDTLGVYFIADDEYRKQHPDAQLYLISKEGSSAGILKKLAYTKVSKMGDAMQEVLEGMLLSNVINIYDHYIVESVADSEITEDARFFIPAYDTAETYTFIYDSQGKYFKNNRVYLDATAEDLGTAGSISFVYAPVKNGDSELSEIELAKIIAEQNLYYKTDAGTYEYNLALCTYLLARNKKENIYYRKSVAASTADAITMDAYPSSPFAANLYVEILGQRIKYSATNAAHAGLPILRLHESSSKDFFVRLDEYTSDFNPDTDVLYSKQFVENIYFKNENGNLVFFNGAYTDYDADNELHKGLTRYNMRRGFVATKNQSYYMDGTEYKSDLSPEKISVSQEKSAAVLRMLKKNKVTVKNMSDVINTAKIGDIMDITPDNIFDNDALKNATINTMNTVLSDMLQSMTIGDLLDWGNITTIDSSVKDALKEVTLPNFFKSLSFANDGSIIVDMEKVYGYKK